MCDADDEDVFVEEPKSDKAMSWLDFKNYVDKELAKQKIPQTTDIWYIDISFPMEKYISVHSQPRTGIAIG